MIEPQGAHEAGQAQNVTADPTVGEVMAGSGRLYADPRVCRLSDI